MSPPIKSATRQRGFTLIELVIAMAIMGVVSVFSIKFITNSVGIYQQGKDREQLMSDIRFGIERLNREVRNAVPGSLRIEDTDANEQTTSGACVRFWPIDTARRYKNIVLGSSETTVIIPDHELTIKIDDAWIIISPLGLDSSTQLCPDNDCAVAIASGSVDDTDPSQRKFSFPEKPQFSLVSTKRVFFAKNQVRYCITPQAWLTRSQTDIGSNFSSAVLMAEHISAGNFSKGSNEGEDADLYSQLTFDLTASKNNEAISFSHKIRLYNAP
ncbi:hypothetical protein CBP31_00445 [Oceanisphaera profunda]|uniref:MSHA biogenesis protein MshO n=1 Tax=Oceanisphaera profunda TaxID=1416627 RepID=A0A1Y0D194_9GAMM|nr:type II secretion system protein [Oceanisphaera profunda]ART81288.1 hypothetical protein CBP31_00445 [Oceanisphaera profunda]